MTIGVVGKKSGMTRLFADEGTSVPVTVISVEPNRVTQVKTPESDGYFAVQITTGSAKPSRVTRPMAGHFAKARATAGRGLWEFRLNEPPEAEIDTGAELNADQFEAGQKVDVSAVSKGKGYAGTVKRWKFGTQGWTHGNSGAHRAPGSIGQCQTPGRVFKGKKMAGHMGAERVTTQNLTVVRVDVERNLLFVKGAVPGPAGGDVYVRPAIKAAGDAA
ncbi:MAG: 50S ribosomal protein L3 [Gammaproteobacteria bacterium]|nr:50S ribosomal protein L3 [Gammaproteobacteria bacterium]